MTVLTDTDRRQVASIMRAILRTKFTPSFAPRHVVAFIFDEGLLKVHLWPGTTVELTERGREFLGEVEGR